MRGLKCSETLEDRISLYADDILLFLASPLRSFCRVLDIFTIFGRYSGYSINWGKSILYILSGDPPTPFKDCPVQFTTTGFKYFGIFISPNPQLRYERNLLPPLQRLRRDVDSWKTLPLSLLG